VLENSADSDFLDGLPSSRWPQFAGFSAFASDGVANAVANPVTGDGTITYVEAGFAKVRGFPVAWVRNSAGVFAQPTASNVSRALAYAHSAGDGTLTLAYRANDRNVYFPSSYSYVIAQTQGFSPDKGAVLGTFLNYAVTKGQDRAEPLGYARLSSVIVNAALNNIQRIPGAPPRPRSINAPPPPVIHAGGSNAGSSNSGRAPVSGPAVSGVQPGIQGGPAAPQVSATVLAIEPQASHRGPTAREALWTMLQGAFLCALGIAMIRGMGARADR